MLTLLLRSNWLLGLITGVLTILFIASSIAILKKAEWGLPVLTYTIYVWLLYVWIHGLKKILGMVAMLKWEKAKSISQFMGRSRFFDELLEKSIDLSKESVQSIHGEESEAHAVSDSPLEALLNDEELFKEVFPEALRKKIRRQFIALMVQTLFFALLLWQIKS